MDISSLTNSRRFDSVRSLSDGQNAAARQLTQAAGNEADSSTELRSAFDTFVGETFYGQMLKAMRKCQQEPAYFHGGQAENMFREQLDQTIAQKLAETNASSLSGSMFELFQLNRK